MKRILIFSLVYYPKYIGGAEVAIKEITDRILPSDYEFHMITLRFDSNLPKEEKIGNVMLYRLGFVKRNATIMDLGKFPLFLNKYLLPVTGFFKAWELHRAHKYDIVWNMMANHSAFAGLFFKLTRPRVKYLLSLQEGDPIEHIRMRVRLVYPIFKKIFTKADFIQTISIYLAGWARSEGYKGDLLVVPNGVDTEYFSKKQSAQEIIEVKKELGKKEGDIYLVTTSRLVKKNACDDVIRALSFLPQNIRLLVIGIGPDEEELKLKTKNLKLESRVVFLGEKSHKKIPWYLNACDIFIRPSLSEGMGNVFIEAMAAGLPVIATPVGGIVDFLKDKETGLFCNVRDPKSIAEKVKLYLNDKELREKIILNALKMVCEKYDWNLITRDMKEKIFDKILK